ncbi:restriction endonuclease subunit S [Helicobacter cinaedi]|uniref:restriction endonuclease subunit S n=1 Tax=Helicobacter cinaedi TaxID=213 RepID=UPI000D7C9E67|nr:restriction endonuclease subunit S [Helicobacter cinaedi]
MKTDTLKKSLLDYAIKGSLTAKFRRENNGLNAFDELEIYNDNIKQQRKDLEKELKKCEKEFKLEKDKDKKALFKSQIQMLKKELIKCKEITPLNSTEAPFTIPNSWAWVKLGDICEINPKNDISDNVEISFIPMALIADSCQNTFTYELKLWKEVKGGFTHLCDNSVAFAKISPCFENGKSFVVKNLKNGYGAGTTELIVLLPYNPLLKEYVFYCVNSAFFVNQALKTFKGTAGQQRLNMDFVENFTIPLPPLKEQEHIVQTLDTLFTLKKGLRVE